LTFLHQLPGRESPAYGEIHLPGELRGKACPEKGGIISRWGLDKMRHTCYIHTDGRSRPTVGIFLEKGIKPIMKRRTEGYTDTKAELIGAAWQLFAKNGYDGIPIQAIIDKVGLSKGTFYHYFSCKEEVLDAVVGRMTKEGFDQIAASLQDESLLALEKLNRFFAASWHWKLSHIGVLVEVARVLYRDENIIIRHKMNMRTVALVTPPLANIIGQGVEEGVFDVVDPEEMAMLILHLGNCVAEVQVKSLLELEDKPGNLEVMERRINLYMDALERILGAPKGSVEGVRKGFIEEVSRAVLERE